MINSIFYFILFYFILLFLLLILYILYKYLNNLHVIYYLELAKNGF